MAIRSKVCRPDVVLETANGPIAHVSDDAFYRAVMDAATAIQLVGGEMHVIAQRAPTDMAHESVTVAALVEWRDHRNAKSQPEPSARPAVGEMVGVGEVAELQAAQDAENEAVTRELVGREMDEAGVEAELTDGLDHSQLEEEDLSEVPEFAR